MQRVKLTTDALEPARDGKRSDRRVARIGEPGAQLRDLIRFERLEQPASKQLGQRERVGVEDAAQVLGLPGRPLIAQVAEALQDPREPTYRRASLFGRVVASGLELALDAVEGA